MRLVGLVGVAALAGCGRVSFDAVANSGDDAGSGSNTPDAFVVGCWPAWRAHTVDIQDPALITELNTSVKENDPVLSANGKNLYFASERDDIGDGVDFWVASRPSVGAPFGAPMRTPGLSSPGEDGKQWISADELSAVVASIRNGGSGSWDLWMAGRASTSEPFTVTQNGLGNVNTGNGEDDPYVTPDGLTLYYAADAGGSHMLRATRPMLSRNFSAGTEVLSFSTGNALPTDGMLSPDGLVAFFTSHAASADLYYATRPSTAVDFSFIAEVPNVNTGGAEFDIDVSDDGCELFYASAMGSGNDYELYRSTVSL